MILGAYHAAGGTGLPACRVTLGKCDCSRRIFHQGNGTPITPGNFLIATEGGTVLNKRNFTAADGVPTGVYG